MKTEILKIDVNNICKEKIVYAANILKLGGLVAFPTETVYGLGANAFNTESINKIFEAKGRPSDNPLIVHIADISALDSLVSQKPDIWIPLAKKYWPGPLTLVFKKSSNIPYEITAGLDTVAIRMPVHPIALALIKASGLPIAAPSANSSGKPSPTMSNHVIKDLNGKIDLIIDGGNTDVGLESTVLDISTCPPLILRPGGVTIEHLRNEISDISLDPALLSSTENGILDPEVDLVPKSPGLKYKHYSPKAPLVVVDGHIESIINRILQLVLEENEKGKKIGILATEQTKAYYRDKNAIVISLGNRNKPEEIATSLFSSFREMDEQKVDIIFSEGIDKQGIGFAVMNRMKKAASYNIIIV